MMDLSVQELEAAINYWRDRRPIGVRRQRWHDTKSGGWSWLCPATRQLPIARGSRSVVSRKAASGGFLHDP